MRMLIVQAIPSSMIILMLTIGALIFVAFKAFKAFRLPVLLLRKNGLQLKHASQKVEILAWLGFVLFVLYALLQSSLVITLVFIVILGIAFWRFWQNFFTGLGYKLSAKFEEGDVITVGENKGKIDTFGHTALKLVADKGAELLVPYIALNGAIKIDQQSSPKVIYKTLALELNQPFSLEFEKSFLNKLTANPWIVINKPVDIKLEDNKLNLSFYVMNNQMFERAKLWIEGSLNS